LSGEQRNACPNIEDARCLKFNIRYDIFNCNWVDTRWQYYSTHLQTNNTQNNTIDKNNNKTTQFKTIHRTTQFNNYEECGSCPIFARFTLAFALQLRKKQGKPSVKVARECQNFRECLPQFGP